VLEIDIDISFEGEEFPKAVIQGLADHFDIPVESAES
jgi:hypothetical protein